MWCFLYPALKATHEMAMKLGIDLRLRVFVDDIRCRVAAPSQADAAKGAASILHGLLNNLTSRQCEVSKKKTILMGSTKRSEKTGTEDCTTQAGV